MVILAHIREQHRLSLQSYGRPRMTKELQELGLNVGHRRIGRLMRENDIKIVRTQKYKVTTDSNHAFNIAPNLLEQDFSASDPNQKWAGDISYIWTSEGWLYLAVILDLYSRRVIGGAVSNRMKRDLAIRALDMAVALQQPPEGCIHHTDRGSQYCSHDYQKRLSKHGFKVSMSGRGNCYDNSMVETFFKSIKAELIWRNRWKTRRQAEGAIFEYINDGVDGCSNASKTIPPARDEKRLLRLQRQLAKVKLLIIDELGFVPLSKTGAELLFELISQRYERGSTPITSNLPFEERTETFGTERLTGALLDRLTHHVNILEMNGENYRLNQSRSRLAKTNK